MGYRRVFADAASDVLTRDDGHHVCLNTFGSQTQGSHAMTWKPSESASSPRGKSTPRRAVSAHSTTLGCQTLRLGIPATLSKVRNLSDMAPDLGSRLTMARSFVLFPAGQEANSRALYRQIKRGSPGLVRITMFHQRPGMQLKDSGLHMRMMPLQ